MRSAAEYINIFHGISGIPSLECVGKMIEKAQTEAYESGQRLAYKRIADDIGRDHPKTALAIYQLPIKPYGDKDA